MTLEAGTRLGAYEITAPLGAGGMGEVYRARDTKLGRDVAVKVLPEDLAQNEDRLARFEREARVLAALNHPHIATLHSSEQEGETRFLVMEVVEGEDLAVRLKRGPLRLSEALPLFLQVSEGLEAAHESGIIHRDLKPGNIKISGEGTAKILDFGLAKWGQPAAASVDDALSQSPTESATLHGTILGTAAYMSPEQAQGKTVDKRTDIWAFGCCLYEALTGDRAFRGDTAPRTLAKVLERDPKWEGLPANTPGRMRELLHRCLAKDPRHRLHDIADARLELAVALEDPARAAAAAGQRGGLPSGPARPARAVRTIIPLPSDAPLALTSAHPLAIAQPAVAISPDGSSMVYVADRGETTQLYLRPLDRLEFTAIPGTEGAYHPVFSPDGSEVAFATPGYLKKVRLPGAEPKTLCESKVLTSVTWGHDGWLYFDRHFQLTRVPDEGGQPELIGHPAVSLFALPEGRGLFLTDGSRGTWGRMDFWPVAHLSLQGGATTILESGHDARYLSTGHLLFVRRGQAHAAPFSLERLQLTGRAAPVVEQVWIDSVWAVSQLGVSDNGTLVYVRGGDGARTVPTWIDRQGQEEPLALPPQVYGPFRLSPDGKRLAIQVTDPTSQIYVHDLERRTFARLTLDGINMFPIWTADGRGVICSRAVPTPGGTTYEGESIRTELVRQAVDGSGGAQKLLGVEELAGEEPPGPLLVAEGFSADGTFLFLVYYHPTRNTDIWVLPMNGEVAPWPVVATEHMEGHVSFSSDGRWFTFMSDKTGRAEIFVRPFPEGDGEWQISDNGGEQARWSPKGDEIFYRDGTRLMVVPVLTEPEFRAGTPRVLFETDFFHCHGMSFDVSADGQRFLVLKPVIGEEPVTELQLVVNWFQELKEKMREASSSSEGADS